jgi:hypothetical protein
MITSRQRVSGLAHGGLLNCMQAPRSSLMGVERVTRIELALSAWEPQRLPLPGALTSQVGWPVIAVVVPSSPWLMAR